MGSSRLDFAIVGAPKCGTTSLFQSLNERSDIAFLGKDSHLLGGDLDLLLRDQTLNPVELIQEYSGEYLLGDASVWYLFSEEAAKEIHQLNPNCKIIICLRNPFELLPSLHNQHLKGGDETETNINRAIAMDENPGTIAEGVHFRRRPGYLESMDFAKQIARYDELFSDLHFVFYDDLKNDFSSCIRQIEDFLKVPPREKVERVTVNQRKEISNPKLVRILKKKPTFLKSVFRTVVPSKKLRHKIMQKAMDTAVSDHTDSKAGSLDTETQEIIRKRIQKQLPLLEKLTGRDCSYWIK